MGKNIKKSRKEDIPKRLTIGMIVKNEEKHLPHCLQALQSLREQVDSELIIADTGSTDRTREIAQEYADLLFDFQWCDDFSAARNAVLKKSKGEWHLFIDADEYIDEDISELVAFLNATERKKYNAASINILAPLEIAGERISVNQFYSYRLFRAEGNQFNSLIHEAIIINKPLKVLNTTLHHWGYIYETLGAYDQKCARNSKLLRKKLEGSPDILQVVCYCLDSCNNEQDREELIERGLKILEKKPGDPLSGAFYGHLMSYYSGKDQTPKAIAAGESYLQGKETILAKDIDIIWRLIEFYKLENEQQKRCKACEWYLTLRDMFERDELDKSELQYTLMSCYEERLAEEAKITAAQGEWKQLHVEKSVQILRAVRIEFLTGDLFHSFLSLLLQITETAKEYSLLRWCYGQMRSLAQTDSEEERERYHFFEAALKSFFLAVEEQLPEMAQVFVNCDPEWKKEPLIQFFILIASYGQEGFSSRLASYMEHINDWEQANEVVYHLAVKHQVALPNQALAVGSGRLDEILCEIAKAHPQWQEELMAYCSQKPWQEDVNQHINQCDFLIRAFVQRFLWEEETIEEKAVKTFLDLLQDFMERIYQDGWINEITADVLPALHQFGYWMKEGKRNWSQGDKTAYLQSLKRAAQSAPLLKKIPAFYVEKFEAEQAAAAQREREFTALAAKIREAIDSMLKTGQEKAAINILKQYISLCPDDTGYLDLLKELET